MIKYPITRSDLLRSVMVKIESAHVVFDNPVLRQFQLDQEAGLCTMEIVKGPETQSMETIYDVDGVKRTFLATRQNHFVAVFYHDPEIEMIRRLSI